MRIIVFLLLWCAASAVWAQDQSTEKRITENGKTYILYKVQQGETLYSIGRRYHVDISELTVINPQLAAGLKSGEVIRIPVAKDAGPADENRAIRKPDRFISHTVQRKETLYSLSKKYGVTIEEILTSNPGKTDLKKGDILRIPQWTEPQKTAETGIQSKGGRERTFVNHTIRKGETLYSISRKYGISTDLLVELNPSLKKSCKTGTTIRIPGVSNTEVAGKEVMRKKGMQHIVSKGETLYEISRKYDVTVDEIVTANPFLESRVPHAGDTLMIVSGEQRTPEPEVSRDKSTTTGTKSDCDPLPASMRDTQTIRVALLLPLMLTENKLLNQDLWNQPVGNSGEAEGVLSDTLRTEPKLSNMMQFHGNSENFLHFYEGALLAIDSLKQAGIKVELEVWDTEQKSSKVRNFGNTGVLNKANLIIGPVYPNEQKEIADFATRHRIPVISPLSSSEELTRENEYFFQVNPSREYTVEKTREYIVSAYRNSNIVVLQTSNSGNEAENETASLRKELEADGNKGNTSVRMCNFRKDGYASLREMMVKDKKNVLVLPAVNEAEVSVVVSNMKNLSAEFDVVVIGNNRFPQFESIDPEYFHLGNLEFLTPYWPDMNQQVTRSFIHNFRLFFRTEPNQYSIQGYDVTFFFVKALSDFGSGFSQCISSEKVKLVQGTYHFSRLPSGGYINKGLSVVQYLPSFEIVRKKVIAE